MSTTNQQQPAPDYGEPWIYEEGAESDEEGWWHRYAMIMNRYNYMMCKDRQLDDNIVDKWHRIVACVNACAGMTDPAAEIQAMRRDLEQALMMVGVYKAECDEARDELADIRQRLKGHADSKLDGENGLAAATMRGFDGFQAENEAMREAIGNAFELLQGVEEHLDGNRGMFVQAALDKLQPFTTPGA